MFLMYLCDRRLGTGHCLQGETIDLDSGLMLSGLFSVEFSLIFCQLYKMTLNIVQMSLFC